MVYYEEAYKFAYNRHKGQKRKFVGTDYISHPVWVAELIIRLTNDPILAAAGLLHDTVEDTTDSPLEAYKLFEELLEYFGVEVAYLVAEVTIDETIMKLKGKPTYLADRMLDMSLRALLLKLCDRLHNVMGLFNPKIPTKFVRRYINETDFIISKVKDRKDLKLIHKALIKRIEATSSKVKRLRMEK